MKKIGLVGCGAVANYGHLPAITNTPGLQLGAIFDPDAARLQAAQEKFGGEAFSESEAFFNSGLDAVVVTSPAPFHLSSVQGAARHGLPVLCEKPLAMNESEIEEMIALMNARGVPLYTGFTYRFSPAALKIKQLLDEGAIGALRSLRLIYIWNLHGKWQDGVLNARREGRFQEGGVMVDCGVHQIDLARWWTGSEIQSQHSHGAWVENHQAPDHQYLHLDHKNGAHTMVEISYSYCHTAKEPINHFSYHLIGEEGVIRFERESRTFELRNTQGTQHFPFHSEKAFEAMYAAFSRALETGEAGALPVGEDGLIATRVARLATEEAVKHKESQSRRHGVRDAAQESSSSVHPESTVEFRVPAKRADTLQNSL